MSDKLTTALKRYPLKALRPLAEAEGHKNARYMTAQQHQRLVENIRRDGVLTSLPLVARCESSPKELLIVSGNHRVAAAKDAGLTEVDVIEIQDVLPKARLVAIQLAHNAIEGQDDKAILKSLYEDLAIEWQEYSGLTDDAFELEDLNVTVLSGIHPLYREVVFAFLPNDAQAVDELLKSAEKWAAKERPVYVAQAETFAAFFEAMVAVKQAKNVKNSAVALALLCELGMAKVQECLPPSPEVTDAPKKARGRPAGPDTPRTPQRRGGRALG